MTDVSSRSVLAALPKARLAELGRSFGVALPTATNDVGALAQTYNGLKDPDCHESEIVTLRRLHEEMDRAVLDAYGWTELEVPPFCPTTPAEHQALERFKDEVIDRLFVLNAERAAERSEERGAKSREGREEASEEIEGQEGEPAGVAEPR